MKLTRSEINKYLDENFKMTSYSKKSRGVQSTALLKEMQIDDLDFIDILEKFYSQINLNYDSFSSKSNWTPSPRQKGIIDTQLDILNDIALHKNKEGNLINYRFIKLYDDFYWGVWDFFYDYNNKTDVVKEEVDLILPILETFLKESKKIKGY